MAKIVIAGVSNCPYFARVELLADTLEKNLPDFKLHKIVKQPNEWQSWLEATCKEKGWNHTKSPLVWRELINRGGKGVLIGDANDFQEYACGYYGISSSFVSDDMRKIAGENLKTKEEVDKEEAEFRALSKPLHICVTNASSDVCYNMLHGIGRGGVFGPNTEVVIRLFDSEENLEYLEGVGMEAFDLACPLLRDIKITTDVREAFTSCHAVIMLDEIEKNEEEDKSDWLKKNAELFTNYAKVLDEVANKNVKVLVAGDGPVNFNAFMMLQHITNISRHNIAAMSRMVENNAKAIIAERLKVNSADVVDIITWGNANGTVFTDMSKARVHNYDGAIWGPPFYSRPAVELVHDDKWLEKEFLDMLAERTNTVQTALKKRPTFCRSAAVVTQMGHWFNGTPEGQMFSLGVCSEGWYGVPEGLVFSFPITMSPKGYWSVVQDVELGDESKQKIQNIVKELVSEKEVIYPPPHVPTPTPPPQPTPEPTPPPKECVDNQDEKKDESEKEKSDTSDTEGTTTSNTDSEVETKNEPLLEKIEEDKAGEEQAAKNSPEGTEA